MRFRHPGRNQIRQPRRDVHCPSRPPAGALSLGVGGREWLPWASLAHLALSPAWPAGRRAHSTCLPFSISRCQGQRPCVLENSEPFAQRGGIREVRTSQRSLSLFAFLTLRTQGCLVLGKEGQRTSPSAQTGSSGKRKSLVLQTVSVSRRPPPPWP